MWNPTDLDEYDEHRLTNELLRRKTLQDKGLCDYCEREPNTRLCKFPQRHNWSSPDERGKRKLLDLLPYYNVRSGGKMTQPGGTCLSFQTLSLTRREKPGPSQYTFEVQNCTRIDNLEISPDKINISVELVTDPTNLDLIP